MKTWRRLSGVAVAATVVAVTGLCGSTTVVGAASKATGTPLVFGTIGTLSGPASTPEATEGFEAYVKNWNDEGGYRGHPIKLIVKDDQANSSTDADAARSLVLTDRVIGMVNPLSYVDCAVNNQFYIAQQIGVLGGGCQGNYNPEYNFPINNPNSTSGLSILAKYAAEHGARKVAIISIAALGGTSVVSTLRAYLSTLSVSLIVEPPLPLVPTAADADAAITTIKSQGVKAIIGLFQPQSSAIFLQEGIRNSFGPSKGIMYMWAENLDAPQFAASLPGTFCYSPTYPWTDTTNPSVKEALAVVRAQKVSVLDGFTGFGWNIGAMLQEVLNRVKGPVTRASFVQALRHTTGASQPLAPIKVDLANAAKTPSGGVVELSKGGKWVTSSPYLTSKY